MLDRLLRIALLSTRICVCSKITSESAAYTCTPAEVPAASNPDLSTALSVLYFCSCASFTRFAEAAVMFPCGTCWMARIVTAVVSLSANAPRIS